MLNLEILNVKFEKQKLVSTHFLSTKVLFNICTELFLLEIEADFTVQLKDTNVVEEEPLTLVIKLTKKVVDVTWLKDGEKITIDEHIKIVTDDTTIKFVIKQTTINDTGVYTVVVGNKKSTCRVTVKGKIVNIGRF